MDELADSAGLIDDPDGLRRRLAADGYVFFRGLLPAGQVRSAGHAVLAQLRSGGWVDDRAIPSIPRLGRAAGTSTTTTGSPASRTC